MNKLIKQLKESNEDHEFYPTTREIVYDLHKQLIGFNSTPDLLDIGAGNGILFKQLRELDKSVDEYTYSFKKAYAIEKSQILIAQMEPSVFVIGTDFNSQTLLDKSISTIFCNPPYSEYEKWSTRIIKEANCTTIYLVIPTRWTNSDSINQAIKQRESTVNVIGEYSFEDSEFRKARATVNLIEINLGYSNWGGNPKVDPFKLWFDDNFKSTDDVKIKKNKNTKDTLHELVKGKNLIEHLSGLYLKELNHIQESFNKITSIDSELLSDIGVDESSIVESLKVKYSGLKNLYWTELFDNLKKLTDRLTERTRGIMVEQLTTNTSVDFTQENAYSVVIWAIKNANKYMDDQLVDVFKWLSEPDFIKNYKSNDHFYKDSWRFNQEATHYTLDYRIVTTCSMFCESWNRDDRNRLNDIFIIAKNLGFDIVESAYDIDINRGKSISIHYTKNGIDELFCECRFYQNGNGHFKFNKDFMMKMNVEVGRILCWVNTPKEASEEMDIPMDVMTNLFNSNLQIGLDNVKLLGC